MAVYYSVLTVLYTVILVILSLFILWDLFRTRKVTYKIYGALALIMFVLRFFFIK